MFESGTWGAQDETLREATRKSGLTPEVGKEGGLPKKDRQNSEFS